MNAAAIKTLTDIATSGSELAADRIAAAEVLLRCSDVTATSAQPFCVKSVSATWPCLQAPDTDRIEVERFADGGALIACSSGKAQEAVELTADHVRELVAILTGEGR